jgi:hypothetical protein
VTALDAATGEPVWSTRLRGLGPVEHSKYRNRVQIALDPDGQSLSVYGFESSGRYTEQLALVTGERLAHQLVDTTLAEIERRPHEDDWSFPKGPVEYADGDARFRFVEGEHEGAALVERVGAWRTELRAEGGCGDAAMRRIEDELFLVRWCAISSGAELVVLDAETGAIVTTRPLRALGPVAHSEYMNTVELDLVHDHLVVFGFEASGDYIEVVDPGSKRTRVSRTFR